MDQMTLMQAIHDKCKAIETLRKIDTIIREAKIVRKQWNKRLGNALKEIERLACISSNEGVK